MLSVTGDVNAKEVGGGGGASFNAVTDQGAESVPIAGLIHVDEFFQCLLPVESAFEE